MRNTIWRMKPASYKITTSLLVLIMTSTVATLKFGEWSRVLEERTVSFCGFRDEDVKELGMSQTVPALENGKDGEPLWHPIKIHVDTYNIKHLSQEYQSYLKDVVIAQAHQILMGLVQVQSDGWIDQNEEIIKKCNFRDNIVVQKRYEREPVKADFIIFIAVTTGKVKQNFVGKANPCYWENGTSRPLAGFVVLDYHSFQPNRKSRETSADKFGNSSSHKPRLATNQIKQDVYNYLHEILHALIFSQKLFEKFPDFEGQPQMGECSKEKGNLCSFFICLNKGNY